MWENNNSSDYFWDVYASDKGREHIPHEIPHGKTARIKIRGKFVEIPSETDCSVTYKYLTDKGEKHNVASLHLAINESIPDESKKGVSPGTSKMAHVIAVQKNLKKEDERENRRKTQKQRTQTATISPSVEPRFKYLKCSIAAPCASAKNPNKTETNTVRTSKQGIVALIDSLVGNGYAIPFNWIPSHLGIQKNEVADNAAKSAAADSVTDDVAVRMEDLRNICKNRILKQWQLDWNNSNAKLKQIKPEVGKSIYPTDLNRREQVQKNESIVDESKKGVSPGTSKMAHVIAEMNLAVQKNLKKEDERKNRRKTQKQRTQTPTILPSVEVFKYVKCSIAAPCASAKNPNKTETNTVRTSKQDDTILIAGIIEVLQRQVDRVVEYYSEESGLALNVQKTKFMTIRKARQQPEALWIRREQIEKNLLEFRLSLAQMRIKLPATASISDRFGVSDRATAAIASSVIQNLGMITEEDMSLVIDKSKIRREKQKARKILQEVESVAVFGRLYSKFFRRGIKFKLQRQGTKEKNNLKNKKEVKQVTVDETRKNKTIDNDDGNFNNMEKSGIKDTRERKRDSKTWEKIRERLRLQGKDYYTIKLKKMLETEME
ncbi:hypothetical protein ILUMI_09212 [Ignelater luminosus]|uniref:RNase H type-1 domain-containing protein n=1 Tax=Ignelater luminosus TaxID=2038154 RepID=A0A8K0D072_IGNLU|nr:hypothetical protein ILUMI_09212 [Ignelater luminosus]